MTHIPRATRSEPSASEWVPVPTLAEAVGDWLAEEILHLRIKPGSRLTETEVATALGVSRQPVREAMRILSEQGLLVRIPRVGAVVAGFEPKGIVELYEARGIVESWLVAAAIANATDDELLEIEADARALAGQYEAGFDPGFYDQAWDVITRLYSLSGNSFAVQLASDLRARLRSYPRVLRIDPHQLKAYQEHILSMIALCRNREVEEARDLVVEFLNTSGARLSAFLRANLEAAQFSSD